MLQLKSFLLLTLCFISATLFGDQIFEDKNQNKIRIAIVTSVHDIDLEKSQDILVRSFMDAYEDISD